MERKEFRVHVLDMNNLSGEEKAKILYNHLAFSGIPDEYFESVRAEKRYYRIIFHRNYNPRIIEFVCNPNRYSKIPAAQFFEYIMKQLDNPQEIWANEYDDRLQPADRILLQTIYSMTTTTVNAVLVRRCFERRIAGIPTIDKTLDQYTRSLNRLNEGFIKIIDNRGSQELSMQNPSVNDFLDSRLRVGTLEYQELIDSICTDKQLRLIPEKERLSYAVDLLQTGRIDEFLFIESRHRSRFIARCILTASLFIQPYESNLHDFLGMCGGNDYWLSMSYGEMVSIVRSLRDSSLWEFYHLKEFFSRPSNLTTLLKRLSLDDAISIINTADSDFSDEDCDMFVDQIEDFLDNAITDYCHVNAEDYDYRLDIDATIKNTTSKGTQIDVDKVASALDERVVEFVIDNLNYELSCLPSRFEHYYWDVDYSGDVEVYGAIELVENYLSDIADDNSHQDDNGNEYYSPIDAIFER